MSDFNIESYIFNTLTGEGTLFGKDDVVRNPLTTPYSMSKKLSDTRLEIYSDDGNESSYGFDVWEFCGCGEYVKLFNSYGRDMFEGQISDYYKWNMADIQSFPILTVSEFDAMYKLHIQDWEEKTANPAE